MEAAGPYYAFEQLPLGPDKPLKKAEGGGGRRPRSRWWWCCGSRKHESRFIRLNAKRPTLARFPHNRVVNTKYTVVSFVPKVLYEQFKYFFNLYFLLVALSQFFPPLQIGLLVTYVAPLVFVLAVTMTKEGYDDLKRWKTDREINRELYTRLLPGGATETIRAQDIKVGHLLRLQTNQRVPADMVLLRTSASSGVVFLRTDQLDGETDWKLRTAAPSCQKLNSDEAPRCRDTPERLRRAPTCHSLTARPRVRTSRARVRRCTRRSLRARSTSSSETSRSTTRRSRAAPRRCLPFPYRPTLSKGRSTPDNAA